MRRLVGLLMVAALIATGVAVAAASSGAGQAPATTPTLSPVQQFFSLSPPRPQKPKTLQVLPPSQTGDSCPVAAAGSQCSRIPCKVFVAPTPPNGFHLVPGSPTCTGAGSSIARPVPITAR